MARKFEFLESYTHDGAAKLANGSHFSGPALACTAPEGGNGNDDPAFDAARRAAQTQLYSPETWLRASAERLARALILTPGSESTTRTIRVPLIPTYQNGWGVTSTVWTSGTVYPLRSTGQDKFAVVPFVSVLPLYCRIVSVVISCRAGGTLAALPTNKPLFELVRNDGSLNDGGVVVASQYDTSANAAAMKASHLVTLDASNVECDPDHDWFLRVTSMSGTNAIDDYDVLSIAVNVKASALI